MLESLRGLPSGTFKPVSLSGGSSNTEHVLLKAYCIAGQLFFIL